MSTQLISPRGGELRCSAGQNPAPPSGGTASGCPRDFFGKRFVYTVISPRAHGLSVGVNMNPDRFCNFDCAYCEVDRTAPPAGVQLDIPLMIAELDQVLALVRSGHIRERENYRNLPEPLLKLRHVTLSGDGEPTLCPIFADAVEAVVHLRARGDFGFFKLVLVTNGSGLDRPEVERGLALLNSDDEVWAKLEAGTQEYFSRVNHPDCSIDKVTANILQLALRRPVIIQSLFPAIEGAAPSSEEIEAYVQRLKNIKEAGAQIPLVQIYSPTRPTPHSECDHLPLQILSAIAKRVREVAGLKAQVF